MTLKVAITGNIGSGKSLIANIFYINWQIPIYSADERAKWLMTNSENIVNQVKQILGNDAYIGDQLNKTYVANKIFSNLEFKKAIERIVHQAVIQDYLSWHDKQKAVFTLHEAALIFESNFESIFDKIIYVYAPREQRIAYLLYRGMHIEDIEQRMKQQWEDTIKMKNCHFIIFNDNQHSVIEQVIDVYNHLL